MTEEWRPVVGYEGYYEVSDMGRVRSIDRVISRCDGTKEERRGKILSQFKDRYGYLGVSLNKNGKSKTFTTHRLVCESFLGSPVENSNQVNHMDGIKDNNRLSNLEWCTAEENTKHAIDFGIRGTGNYRGQVLAYDLNGDLKYVLKGSSDMRAKGFSPSGVSSCLSGKLRTHNKHTFKRG
jgi:hypothetical protein